MIVNVTHLTILAPKLCILMGVGSRGLGSYAYFIYKDRYNTGIENGGRYIFVGLSLPPDPLPLQFASEDIQL